LEVIVINRLNIVLVEPEIPQNTGNISRTCAVTGASLHLVKPFGFSISDRYLKRAGLDYWHLLDLHIYESINDFFEKNKDNGAIFYPCTTKAKYKYTDKKYEGNIYLLFGKETAGLPENLILEHIENAIRIPMIDGARSLNLSNSVAIIAYEVLRQWDFENLVICGKFALPDNS